MYVCVCAAVTEDQIRVAAEKGVCSMRELSREYGVATGCGQCSKQARAILDEAMRRRAAGQLESTLSAESIPVHGEQAFA